MGIDDLVSKAKGALGGREEQAKGALDKAARAIKSRTGEGTDAKVDRAVDKAKEFLDKQKRTGQPGSAPGDQGRPPVTGDGVR